MTAAHPILALEDGEMASPAADAIRSDAAHHGLWVRPAAGVNHHGPPAVLASADIRMLPRGLDRRFRGFVQIDDHVFGGRVPTLILGLGTHGILISVTTAATFSSDLIGSVIRGLVERFAIRRAGEFEICLSEAIANATIHGNLGLSGDEFKTLLRSHRSGQAIRQRLADPGIAARRLDITVTSGTGDLEISVWDHGPGFDAAHHHAVAVTQGSPTGRGLILIRDLSRSMSHQDGGRRLVFTFDP